MKTIVILIVSIALLGLVGCSTTKNSGAAKPVSAPTSSAKPGPETVMVVYHVQLGREKQLVAVQNRAWAEYRKRDMVLSRPHVVIRDVEEGGQSRFVEVFTWAKPPDNPPASVRAFWQEEQSLCEARNGHNGIEGGPVELVTGK
jgi:hypothetical protein